MKIPSVVVRLYASQRDKCALLRTKADERIRHLIDRKWHYESRLKGLESYALKLESGKCADPKEMEDFFACTIVVQDIDKVATAEAKVCEKFTLHERRPCEPTATKNESHSFLFEDLRLYVRWQDNPGTRPTGLEGTLFEVQIKTYLQHAWGVATHDLTYKTGEKNWAKERIAFQIKAMLEHAETAIHEAEVISSSSTLDRCDVRSRWVSDLIDLQEEFWEADELPQNRKLLAETIRGLISAVGLDSEGLREVLTAYFQENTKLVNSLSPYGIIVHALMIHRRDAMFKLLKSGDSGMRVLCYPETEESLPAREKAGLVNAITLR